MMEVILIAGTVTITTVMVWIGVKMKEFMKVLESWAYEVAEHLDLAEEWPK